MAEDKNKIDKEKDSLEENAWDTISGADNQDDDDDPDSFKNAFAEFKKTPVFKGVVIVGVLGGLGLVGWLLYALSTMDFSSDPTTGEGGFSAWYEKNSGDFWSFVQIGIVGSIMFGFAIRDYVTFKKGKHLDCKSIIVSLGVLGTFFGIFLGLMGFDASDVAGSVPELLDGLKLAFATSILGMIFTIPLTTIQQMPNIDSRNEMRTLTEMNEKLDSNKNLDDIRKHAIKSSEAISELSKSIKDDLIAEGSTRTNELLGLVATRMAKSNDKLESILLASSKAIKSNAEIVEALKGLSVAKEGSDESESTSSSTRPGYYE